MKKLKYIAFYIFFVFTALCLKAQSDSTFNLIKTINGNFTNFNVDNLDNIYLINTTNQLKKLNARGDSMGVFNDVKRYGEVTDIDVTNPLKILLYYQNFSTIVSLDRFINQINTINLRKQNIFLVNSVTISYDNNIWLFDEQDYKLKKIDNEGKLLQETTDFRLLVDAVPSPQKIADKNNFVYLYDPEKGFYIFDYYGSFKNKLPFLHWNNVGISEKNMYGFIENTLYSYELNSLKLKEYKLPNFMMGYKMIKVINAKLYLLQKDGLYIYQIK